MSAPLNSNGHATDSSERLRPLGPEEVSGEARALYDAVVNSPRAQGPGRNILIREDESLCGPFDAWLRSPGIGKIFEKAGMALREETAMDPAVREIAVLTVARAWGINFEFQVHAMVAKMLGVPEAAIEELARGENPAFERDDLAIAYRLATELVQERRVREDTYQAAISTLGEQVTIEVVTHIGFYQLVSGVLTTFDPPDPSVQVPAPALKPKPYAPAIQLFDAASTTRSVRRLREDPVSDEQIERLIRMASYAPSGGNLQPWHIIVVRDEEKKAALGRHYHEIWSHYAASRREMIKDLGDEQKAPLERSLQAGDVLGQNFGKAPVICVFVFNPDLLHITDIDADHPPVVGGASLYPAVQNFLLACRAEGLGSTLTTQLCEVEPEVRKILDIPKPWAPFAFLPVGYPVGRGHGPLNRRAVDQIAYKDSFGESLFASET